MLALSKREKPKR